jgi:hypothetical protein
MNPIFYSLYTTELLRLGIAEEQAALYFESMAPLCQGQATRVQVARLQAQSTEQARQVSLVMGTFHELPRRTVRKLRFQIAEEIFAQTPSLDAFSISDEGVLDAVGRVHRYVLEQLRRTIEFAGLIGENDTARTLAASFRQIPAQPQGSSISKHH